MAAGLKATFDEAFDSIAPEYDPYEYEPPTCSICDGLHSLCPLENNFQYAEECRMRRGLLLSLNVKPCILDSGFWHVVAHETYYRAITACGRTVLGPRPITMQEPTCPACKG